MLLLIIYFYYIMTPETKSVAIIMTGQTRTFFDNNNFFNMIERTKQHYNNIFIVCVLNSGNHDQVTSYLNSINVKHITVDYPHYTGMYFYEVAEKQKLPEYTRLKDIYMASTTNSLAKNDIWDPDTWTREHTYIQSHQLKIGLMHLRDYENGNNIKFDVICKTRFDISYPADFYPHILALPDSGTGGATEIVTDILDVITFNKTNRDYLNDVMDKFGLKTIDDLITYNKEKQPTLECRVNGYDRHLNFGSVYCYNYHSLEGIKKNGSRNILYALNDLCFFGGRDVFYKLNDFFQESGLIENVELPHFYAPESQLIIYCLKKNIDILCYFNTSFEIIR